MGDLSQDGHGLAEGLAAGRLSLLHLQLGDATCQFADSPRNRTFVRSRSESLREISRARP